MGVDAVWICETCGEVYHPGIRDIFSDMLKRMAEDGAIKGYQLEEVASKLEAWFESYKYGAEAKWLADALRILAKWLYRHRDHEIILTNDHDPTIDEYEETFFHVYRKEGTYGVIEKIRKGNPLRRKILSPMIQKGS